MTRVLGLLLALVVAIGPGAANVEAAPVNRDVPSRDQWLADVKAAMKGSHGVVRSRVAVKAPQEQLAVNFDIDNTVLATYYDGGGAIPKMLKFAKFLQRHHVAVLFNTGRLGSKRAGTAGQLERNGFAVDGLCLRGKGQTLAYGKQRCRNLFIKRGYTLIANVGNNDTDFEGDGYERAVVLPNYDGVLG
jgi:predicted secreted acid phosphatase